MQEQRTQSDLKKEFGATSPGFAAAVAQVGLVSGMLAFQRGLQPGRCGKDLYRPTSLILSASYSHQRMRGVTSTHSEGISPSSLQSHACSMLTVGLNAGQFPTASPTVQVLIASFKTA